MVCTIIVVNLQAFCMGLANSLIYEWSMMNYRLKRTFFSILSFLSIFLVVSSPSFTDNVKVIPGDVNGDQEVNISDVADIIDVLLGNNVDDLMYKRSDVDGNGKVNIDDLSELIDLVLTGNSISISISLSQDSVVVIANQSLQLLVTIQPESASAEIVWYSTDETIAVVEEGLITAIAPGKCDIVAECRGVTAICHVVVLDDTLQSIVLSDDYLTMDVEEVITLDVELSPENLDQVPLVWTSTDDAVATVNNGLVTAIAPGVCDIIVSYEDKKATCQIAVLKKVDVNGVSFYMLPVRGGVFMMGAELGQLGSNVNEKPQHEVTISNYMIGVTEVTQELWGAVMGHIPGRFKGHPQHPVENVSWSECDVFIRSLNERTGLVFHLPTEAQWEYAARGGNRSENYIFAGSDALMSVGWYVTNSGNMGEGHPDYGTHDVATKSPNELNLFDMSGNVNEWCYDWYSTYTADPQTDPIGPTHGSHKVFRGGSWNDKAANCRITFRYPQSVSYKSDRIGLRLAL